MVYGNSYSDDEDTDYDDESSLLGNSKRQGEVVKPWNTFKVIHRKEKTGSMAESKFIDYGVVIIKIITIILVFLLILGSAVTSKITLLLMTSQIKIDITRPYCNKSFDSTRQYNFTVPAVERATWIWLIMFTYFVPEVLTFIRSVYILMFKTWKLPKMWDFICLVVTESLPAFGSALLVFKILPELDVIQAAMLTNGFCIIPSLVNILRNIRPPYDKERFLNITLDILAFIAQISALLIWPINQHKPVLWLIPIASICISFGWWENFVTEKTAIDFIKKIAKAKKDFRTDKYFSYAIISVLKCVLFFATTLTILQLEGDALFIFRKFTDAFSQHGMDVVEVTQSAQIQKIINNVTYQLIIWLVNISSTYACYFLGRFACKIMIQETCFSYPIAVTVPVLVTILIIITSAFEKDNCFFFGSFPKEVTYLFFNISPSIEIEFENSIWLIWLLSQLWITKHIWVNKNIKLSPTEQLFMRPMYDAFLIDQSLALNRRKVVDRITKRSEDTMNKISEIDEDKITRIYACGTMWHEIREEMLEFLKTIFRMDEDQALHRIVKNYLRYPLDNYYEWETHIFFDDAFIRKDKNDNDPHINKYVETLLSVIEEAATEVHETTVRIPPPLICPTPYGGRLTWTLPGKTKLIVHLKDKAKIRPKKRWSQVMYMYYLLGHKLLDNENLTEEKATARSKNTYILALDGDIDFQPKAVHLLVQYMKKNPILGATCGRIHPMGSGVMAWYQKFEYAIGHWMQKATEHVFGCVLCSPGCFSLFRASALMDHNVLARYNTKSQEARHYVQYDQGEDRWLCTLLLQRGYKVEYTAASDAYTHCPESFNDFYIQRRRWMPSTMANVLDLLENSKHVTKINDNISTPYIYYQYLLLVTTIIGPGTIFLMLIGALVTVFNLSQWNSLVYNSIPVAIFVLTCVFCESQTQLTVAGIVSGFYGLVMIAVLIGVAIQIISDGLLVPTSLFFLIIMGQYVIAAMLHPKELVCLVYGVIYLITVPSMYMLLVIYSVFNMNNVSWGTREVTVEVKPTNPEENTEEEEEEKETNLSIILSSIYKIRDFFADCCNNSNLLIMINNSLSNIEHRAYQIERRIDCLENNSLHPESLTINPSNISKTRTPIVEGPRASVVSVLPEPSECDNYDHYDDSQSFQAPSENLHNNSWFYHRDLIKGNVAYLERKEEIFWKELLEKYLKPTQDDKKKVGKELKELRNKMVITFFMLNLLFVLIIFLMTLRKDLLHVQWPFNPSVNFTYTKASYGNEIMIMKTYLQLEPIGLALSAVFFSVMVIQFTCMLRHRLSTFAQIMANSTLNFHLFKPKVENMSHDDLLERDPIKIFKKLIQLKGVNGDDDKEEDSDVARRETVAVLMENKHKKRAMINDLDTAFKERMRKIRRNEDSGVSVPKKTLAAISRRRETVLKTQSETRQPHPSLRRTVSFADENDSKESTHHFDNPAFVDDL